MFTCFFVFRVPSLHKNAIFYSVLTTEHVGNARVHNSACWNYFGKIVRLVKIFIKKKDKFKEIMHRLNQTVSNVKCDPKHISWKQVESILVTRQQKRCIAKLCQNVVAKFADSTDTDKQYTTCYTTKYSKIGSNYMSYNIVSALRNYPATP